MSRQRSEPRGRAAVALAAAATLLVLAGCSSTPAAKTSSGAPAGAVAGDVVKLSGADPSALGKGLKIQVGLDFALSGQGAYYGKVGTAGASLAAAQIKAAGGPDFQLVSKDNKSGDAQAGVATTRELGQAGVHYALYSYIGVLGSAFQGIAQYKILSLDGGGGTQLFGQKKPYFYGTRAQPPNDTFAGLAKYLATLSPKVSKVGMIIGDTGAQNVAQSTSIVKQALTASNITLAGTEVVTYGGTDFSAAVTKLKALQPDVIISAQYGDDTGYFLKQLRAAGSTTRVVGVDYVPSIPKLASSAANDYSFATDYFNAAKPQNDWATYFTKSFQKAYPDLNGPDYYAANYYEDMFTLWQTVQRIVKEKGDVNDPDTILKAFTSNLTFPSVYGESSGKPYGTYAIDATTHTLSKRDMGVYQYSADAVTQKAGFQIGGADFALTK